MIDCIALALLSLMVQTESGFEPLEGKIAVAYVAVNRSMTSDRTLQDVLTQSRQFKINPRAIVSESSAYAARVAMNRLQPDPTYGADHFYAIRVKPLPKWYHEQYVTTIIGSHAFLKLGGF